MSPSRFHQLSIGDQVRLPHCAVKRPITNQYTKVIDGQPTSFVEIQQYAHGQLVNGQCVNCPPLVISEKDCENFDFAGGGRA